MNNDETITFAVSNSIDPKSILASVYDSLVKKGYDAVNQIAGYILSGDPTYITTFNDARNLIRKVERDELVEEVLRTYIENNSWD